MLEDVERSVMGRRPVSWYGKCGGEVPTGGTTAHDDAVAVDAELLGVREQPCVGGLGVFDRP